MKTKLVTVKMTSKDIAFYPAMISDHKAGELIGAPRNKAGEQMAFGIAHISFPDEPVVSMTLVLGDRQTTITLNPADLDQLCHKLADAALWQNEQLRIRSGQAVH